MKTLTELNQERQRIRAKAITLEQERTTVDALIKYGIWKALGDKTNFNERSFDLDVA